jgi:hypothetical protein
VEQGTLLESWEVGEGRDERERESYRVESVVQFFFFSLDQAC